MTPQDLISKTLRGPLRHAEQAALSSYVAQLEKQVALSQRARSATAAQQSLQLSLSDTGALLCTFPGHIPHTVQLSRDPKLAYNFLETSLRERVGKTNFVGSPGAATQAELERLARASRKPARKVGGTALSLEDLGL